MKHQSPQFSSALKNYFLFLYQSNYEKIIKKVPKMNIKKPRGTIRQSILQYLLFNSLSSILYMCNLKKDKGFVKEAACQLLHLKQKTIEWNEGQLQKAIQSNFDFHANLDKGITFLRKFNSLKRNKCNSTPSTNTLHTIISTSKAYLVTTLTKLIIAKNQDLNDKNIKIVFLEEVLTELMNFSKHEIKSNVKAFINSLIGRNDRPNISDELQTFHLLLLVSKT